MFLKFLVTILTLCNAFIPDATDIVIQEKNKYINNHIILCRSQCDRIKTFPSIIHSLQRKYISKGFEMYDLIAFRISTLHQDTHP